MRATTGSQNGPAKNIPKRKRQAKQSSLTGSAKLFLALGEKILSVSARVKQTLHTGCHPTLSQTQTLTPFRFLAQPWKTLSTWPVQKHQAQSKAFRSLYLRRHGVPNFMEEGHFPINCSGQIRYAWVHLTDASLTTHLPFSPFPCEL